MLTMMGSFGCGRLKVEKFALMVSHDREIHVTTQKIVGIVRRIAGLSEMEPGGMVVMSTDVNAVVGKSFLGWAKGFMKTW